MTDRIVTAATISICPNCSHEYMERIKFAENVKTSLKSELERLARAGYVVTVLCYENTYGIAYQVTTKNILGQHEQTTSKPVKYLRGIK